jgi:hypothetical protein
VVGVNPITALARQQQRWLVMAVTVGRQQQLVVGVVGGMPTTVVARQWQLVRVVARQGAGLVWVARMVGVGEEATMAEVEEERGDCADPHRSDSRRLP